MRSAIKLPVPRIHYGILCFDERGELVWSRDFKNLVVNQGLDYILNTGAVTGIAVYMGLITAPAPVSGESVGTGNGTTVTFTHTMANIPVLAGSVSVTAGSVTGTDNGSGTISGTGISGTINYATGALSVTFTTAPASGTAVTTSYSYAPQVAAADTLASHAGWTEFTNYSQTARPTITWGTPSAGSMAGSAVNFSVSGLGTGVTANIGGAFTASNATIGGTTGNLYSAGAFQGGNAPVSNGYTLSVTPTLSV